MYDALQHFVQLLFDLRPMRRATYLVVITLLAVHLYRTPLYDMDFIGYAGNALLYQTQDVKEIHRAVYAEVDRFPNARALKGEVGDEEQNLSRRVRAAHAENFAEFLPCFAIRPAYNFLLFLLSPVGLARAALIVSVVSYFVLGWLVFLWTDTVVLSLLVMLLPPMLAIGRSTLSDAPSIACTVAGLYLLFGRRMMVSGLVVLFASLFLRTDNIVWIAPVLAILWWQGELKLSQGIVLGAVAVLCVLTINYFAGDYGIGMLYYREFWGTPIAPAEMAVKLTARGYMSVFRSGIAQALGSLLIPFLLFGALSWRRSWALVAIGVCGIALHFLILPDFRQERHFLVGYILMAIPVLATECKLRPPCPLPSP